MGTQRRLLLLGAILALLLGWVGLRRGNDALQAQVAAAGERAP